MFVASGSVVWCCVEWSVLVWRMRLSGDWPPCRRVKDSLRRRIRFLSTRRSGPPSVGPVKSERFHPIPQSSFSGGLHLLEVERNHVNGDFLRCVLAGLRWARLFHRSGDTGDAEDFFAGREALFDLFQTTLE